MLSSRERLLITLKGQIADRVPMSPFVQDEYLAYYYPHKSKVDRVIDATELANELDFDLIAKHRLLEKPHFFRKSFPNWEVRQTTRKESGLIYDRLEIVTPKRTLWQEEVGPDVGVASAGISKATQKHLLQDREDIEVFLEYLPSLDQETVRFMHETVREWRKIIGDRGVLAPWTWGGMFNYAATYRGLETLLMDPYLDEDFYRAFVGRMTKEMCLFNDALAQTDVECIGLQGNIGNSRTLGRDFFQEFVRPYEQQIIDTIHAHGKFTVYHNCGCARLYYDIYRDMGMTVWETVSESPQGDNDLAEAKAVAGGRICLLGNLDQVSFLKTATPAQVAEKTRQIVAVGKPNGRYIFSTSDYLEKSTPRENVVAMIEAARDAGRYD